MYTCNHPTDIDECSEQENIILCPQNCTNTLGSYNCSCYEGYEGNGLVCNGTYTTSQQYSYMQLSYNYLCVMYEIKTIELHSGLNPFIINFVCMYNDSCALFN